MILKCMTAYIALIVVLLLIGHIRFLKRDKRSTETDKVKYHYFCVNCKKDFYVVYENVPQDIVPFEKVKCPYCNNNGAAVLLGQNKGVRDAYP